MTYRIQRLVETDVAVFGLSGELDADHVAKLRELIAAEPLLRMRLDLADVTVVTQAGLRFLVWARGTGLELVNCADYIRQWMATEEHS